MKVLANSSKEGYRNRVEHIIRLALSGEGLVLYNKYCASRKVASFSEINIRILVYIK